MNTYTTILHAKDIFKSINIPNDFLEYDVRITVEPVVRAENNILNDLLLLFEEAKDNRIEYYVNVDELMLDINDALLSYQC